MRGGSIRAGVVGLGIVGLLVVVAMAASGGHPTLTGHVAGRPVPDSVQDDFVTLLALAYVVAVGAFVLMFFRYHGQWKEPKTRWLLNYAIFVAVMLAVTWIGYALIKHGRPEHRNPLGSGQQAQGHGSAAGVAAQARRVSVRHAHFQWPFALGIVGLIALGGTLVYVRGRRAPLARAPSETLEETIASALETTIDDLRNERDARRAVIAAYAQMERALSAHGLSRNRAEAPLEYLARVLRGLDVRESAVRTLTRLFEYAKFSPHEIDAAMKEEAIGALVAIRDDLRRDEELAA